MRIGRPFKKGQSGNPGGRPKVIAEVRELARAYTAEAIGPRIDHDQCKVGASGESVSCKCAMDRSYGKPPQHVTGQNANYVALLPQRCETAEEWMATVETHRALTKPRDEV
jgi:hypothetical protein